MSTTNQSTPDPTATKFDKELATLKLTEVRDFYMKLAGKKSYNPFFWLHENVKPFEDKLKNPKFVGDEKFMKEVLSLPKDEQLAFLPDVDEMHKFEKNYVEESKKLPPPALPDRPTKA